MDRLFVYRWYRWLRSHTPPLTPVSQADSSEAVAWLESCGIDLGGRVQLGGHSRKRTHTSTRGPVGFTIMKALLDLEAADPRIRLVTGAQVGGWLG